MYWKRLPWLLLPGLFAVGLDRWTKVWAIQNLSNALPRSFWNDFFRLQYALNEGAFLSLGSGMPENLRYWILAIIPVGVLAYIFIHVLSTEHISLWSQVAFGLILGGGGSNIFDRIAEGYVVDFMNMGIGSLRTGIFNVADMAIMAGLILLIPLAFQKPRPSEAPSPAEPELPEPPSTEQESPQ